MRDEGKKRILVADDNQEIVDIVDILLTGEGYEVVKASNGQEAVDLADDSIDLYILDVVMPVKSGFHACAQIRERTMAPILFLTAKTHDSDKTIGFSAGADDYLAKPFSYAELVFRVKSLLRRYSVYQGKAVNSPETETLLTYRELSINLDSQEVLLRGRPISLTDIEYRLLILMLQHRHKVFSAENLYESIWEEPYFYSANNTIMVHIRNLRKKLEQDPKNPQYIKTIWGKGYCID